MNYLGDFAVGQIVYVWFNTFDSNDPSASVTMTNFINTDVHIHKDDGLTQRNNAAGITVDVDVDAITGSHFIKIDTADNTVADFFEAGHDFAVRIEGTTIDAATVNAVVGTFSIANRRQAGEMCRSAIATLASQTSFTLDTGTASAQDDAYNNCTIIVTDQTTRIQKAVGRISDYTGTSRTVTLAAAPLASGFTMAVADSVEIFANAAFANVDSWLGTLATSGTGGPDVNVNAIGDSTTAATNAVIVYATDFGTNYNTTDDAWVTNGTSFIGTGWNVNKNSYNLTATTGLGNQTSDITGTIDAVTDLTNERGKYQNGAVWIGPTANTNTTSYTDGIITNPVSTIAAAKTIADALKLRRFHTVRTGSTQIGADMTGYAFEGTDWSVTTTGGSRDVGTSAFKDAQVVGGTFAATSGGIIWDRCQFTAAVSVGASLMHDCVFKNTLTLNAAGDYDFVDCASGIPGAAAPTFALGTGAMNVGFSNWKRGITLTGISSDDVITISGRLGGVTLSGADGTVDIRGTYKTITDNRTGSPTLTITGAIQASDVAAILVDTAEIGTAGDGLTNINLPNQTMDIVGDITGNLSGSVGSVTGAVGSVTGAVGSVTGSVGSNVELGPAEVNAEMLDVMNVDTFGEPGQGAPGATISIFAKINYLYKAWRNLSEQNATTYKLYNDAGAVVDQKATVSDDATDASKGKVGTGP